MAGGGRGGGDATGQLWEVGTTGGNGLGAAAYVGMG